MQLQVIINSRTKNNPPATTQRSIEAGRCQSTMLTLESFLSHICGQYKPPLWPRFFQAQKPPKEPGQLCQNNPKQRNIC